MVSDDKLALPGDRLAVIEEFEPGDGVYLTGGEVRAEVFGRVARDFSSRIVKVEPIRVRRELPKPGDVVIGQIEMVQGNIMGMRIYFVNGESSKAGFVGMILLKPRRGKGAKQPTICKLGDLVRAKIVNDIDATLILSIDCTECGVIYATCSLCGGRLAKVGERLKCVECGGIEYRKLAPDFGKVILDWDNEVS